MAAFAEDVAEPVSADHGAGMNFDAVAESSAGIEGDARMQPAIFADARAATEKAKRARSTVPAPISTCSSITTYGPTETRGAIFAPGAIDGSWIASDGCAAGRGKQPLRPPWRTRTSGRSLPRLSSLRARVPRVGEHAFCRRSGGALCVARRIEIDQILRAVRAPDWRRPRSVRAGSPSSSAPRYSASSPAVRVIVPSSCSER